MKEPKAIGTISRGYARNEREEQILREHGIKTVYRADKGETLGKFKMRQGELLGVVSLRAFGEARRDMVRAIGQIHGWGAAIIDMHPNTRLRSDRDGAAMLDRALAKFVPTPEQASAMQEASVRARLKGRKRMPNRDALAIWRNPKFSTHEAVELMFGWAQATAYKELGPRGVPAGRRPK